MLEVTSVNLMPVTAVGATATASPKEAAVEEAVVQRPADPTPEQRQLADAPIPEFIEFVDPTADPSAQSGLVATQADDTTEMIDCGCSGKDAPEDALADGEVLMTTTAVVLPPADADDEATETPETTGDASVEEAQAQVDAMRLIAGQGVGAQVLNQLASQSTPQSLEQARAQVAPIMRQAREVSAAARELSQTLRQTMREFNGLPPADSPEAQELLELRDDVVEKAQALNVAAPLPTNPAAEETDAEEPTTPTAPATPPVAQTPAPSTPTTPATTPEAETPAPSTATPPQADLASLMQALLPLLEAWLSQMSDDTTPAVTGLGGTATAGNTPATGAEDDDTTATPQNSVETPATTTPSPTTTPTTPTSTPTTPDQPDLMTMVLGMLQQQLTSSNPDLQSMMMLLMMLLILPNLMPAPTGATTAQAAA
jgi:hypothetical protein